MWEGLVRAPRGRLSTRKLMTLLTTCLVTIFLHTLLFTTPVNAADANWLDACSVPQNIKQTCLVNDGKEYAGPTLKTTNDGYLGIPDGAVMFFYLDTASNKASVVYFDPGVADAYQSTASAFLVNYVYTDTNGPSPGGILLQNPTSPSPITITPRAQAGDGSINPVRDGTTSCAVEGVGWFICPITTFLASGMDKIYTVVAEYLKVAPLASNTDNALYRAWSYVQGISNLLFIIAFLVVIYSQLTGTVVSAYSIRKILPRTIVAAILVNASYWICAAAVDLSNIIGWSINDLFLTIRDSLVGSEGNTWEYLSWSNMATTVLSGGTIIGGAAIGTYLSVSAITAAFVGTTGGIAGVLMLFVPMLLGVLFVVLMTFLILAARQALIVVLIVMAPLAFVAYLLPNTEKWFERWRSTLLTLLLLYPAFAVVFGGAQLASSVILQSAKGANSFTMLLLAMAVQVAPLAIMPLLLKLGGGVLNRFAGIVNNPSKGIIDKGKQWARDRSSERKAEGLAELARRNNLSPLSNRRRFSPQRMTYNRMRAQMAREQEKLAYESLAKGYFSQTPDAGRIAMISKRAGLEQEIGDNESDAAWQRATYHDPNLNHRVHRAHLAHETAGLYKEAVQEQGKEQWQQTFLANPALRAVRTDKHLTGNRAKLIDEALTNQDQRQFTDALQNDPAYLALRALKVQSGVDASHTALQIRNIDATSKRTFQQQVKGDRALRDVLNQTIEFEKTAGAIENTLKGRGEARYERISTDSTAADFNAGLRQIRLDEIEAQDSLKAATESWNTTLDEIRTKGAAAPGLQSNGEKTMAGRIRKLTRDITLEGMAQEAAKVARNEQLAEDFKKSYSDDPNHTLLKKAAGIGGERAQTRIYAKSVDDVVNASVTEVKTNKAITSELTRRQLHRLMQKAEMPDGTKATVEMQQAAMYALLQDKGNNEDAQEIRDAVAKMGMMVDDNGNYFEPLRDDDGFLVVDQYGFAQIDRSQPITNKAEISRRRDWQQFFDDAVTKSPHNLGTYSGTNGSEARAGTMVDATREGFIRDITGGKFSPDKVLKADIDELKILLEDLHSPTGYYSRISDDRKQEVKAGLESAIIRLQSNENVNSGIEDRARGAMNDILAFVNPEEYAYGGSETKREYTVDENKVIVPRSKIAESTGTKVFVAPINVPGVHRDGSYYTKWDVDTQL